MDWEKQEGDPFPYYVYGAACSEVEIDCLTGAHKVSRANTAPASEREQPQNCPAQKVAQGPYLIDRGSENSFNAMEIARDPVGSWNCHVS